eukprot:3312313-Pyramimonas_sp.AAC.1
MIEKAQIAQNLAALRRREGNHVLGAPREQRRRGGPSKGSAGNYGTSPDTAGHHRTPQDTAANRRTPQDTAGHRSKP